MARTPRVPAKSEGRAKRKLRRGLGSRPTRNARDDQAEQQRRERREEVARLRHQHSLSWSAIGRELGTSTTRAYEDYKLWKREQPPSPIAAEVREEEEPKLLRRAQQVEMAIGLLLKELAKDDKGHPEHRGPLEHATKMELLDRLAKFSREAVRISQSRRSLHGADAPEQKEHSGPGGGPIPVATSAMTPNELLALMEENERAKK